MYELIRDAVFRYATWLITVPFLIALKNHKNYSKAYKLIFYYLLLAVITQVASFYLWSKKVNNLPLLHLYTVLEFLLLLRFYQLILTSYLPISIFWLLATAFLLFAIADSFVLGNIYTFNTYSRTAEALIFIFLAITFFAKKLAASDKEFLKDTGINRINFGFFLYFSGSIALFSFSSYFGELTKAVRMNIWTINTMLVVLLYIFITMGLWKFRIK